MGRFGDFLVGERAVTEEQLNEGMRMQAVYGGRLGTNLVECGFLVLDDLAQLLATYHGLALPEAEWLPRPDPRAAQLIPASIVRRFKLLPLALERETIHVAMLDPKDPDALDFIQAATNRKVVGYPLPEVRLLYWLEMHMGIDRHPRYVNLAARIRQAGLADDQSGNVPNAGLMRVGESASPGEPAITPPREWLGDFLSWPGEAPPVPIPSSQTWDMTPDSQSVQDTGTPPNDVGDTEADEVAELLLDDMIAEPTAAPVTTAPSPNTSRSTCDPSRVVALEAELEGAVGRDDIARIGLELARCYARVAALFVVRGDAIAGLAGSDSTLDPLVRETRIPLSTPSLFVQPTLTRMPYRDAPPPDGIDGRILTALGRADVPELIVIPISIRSRVVNLLYVDNGSDLLGETTSGALTALALCMSRAYERAILANKSKRA